MGRYYYQSGSRTHRYLSFILKITLSTSILSCLMPILFIACCNAFGFIPGIILNSQKTVSKIVEKQHNNYQLNLTDQAFMSLLKDQLNQQLFLFQKIINQDLAHDTQAEKYKINDKKQKNRIAELELMVAQLSKQITQLKKIEQTISGHGQ